MLPKTWFSGAVLALAAVSSAFTFEDLHIDGVNQYLRHGKRQDAEGTGVVLPPQPPVSSALPPAPEPPVSEPSTPSNNNNPPPSQQSPDEVAPMPTPSRGDNNNNSPAPPSGVIGNGPAVTAKPTATRTAPITRTSALVSTALIQFTTTIVTMSGGQQVTQISTGISTSLTTTGQTTYTEAPTEQQGNSDGSDGGISESNKKIIGGVVGGVGGALLLGGIALVFWRIKKRQARVQEDDDDLMAGTGAALGNKPQNSLGSSPPQSSVDQYSSPGGRPNAAANF